ncbi:hypothetical protein KGQ20_17585 [Catenulispora sp. NF23]|uniref:Uncharacterized protein n=1 Tax=Catenulispora pinistramenti TaxID=2705254 RepID=A0ABS5KR75_9ACTN|nr:hypothetical protein [Catenulispora pinistramenti]MBS2534586.1 hypothetical protein [Catenulispora pinistramenti]MBS2548520.1 hypothetical protein [Catenulispora pinistramenti]
MTSQTSLRRLLAASCAGAATAVVLPRAIPMLADTGLLRPATHDDDPENASAAQAADSPARRSGRKTAVLAVGLAYPSYRAWRFTRALRARFSTEEN